MSPAGVSLFYASEDEQTAIHEIAGHGVKPHAVVGRFRNTRDRLKDPLGLWLGAPTSAETGD
jgi:hypothetical protein